MNHTQIRKDLNQLLKKGSYQVILYKTKSNNIIEGQRSLKL